MQDYLILDATGLVVNAASADPNVYPIDPSWVAAASAPAGVWIGWSTPDHGVTWNPPVSG